MESIIELVPVFKEKIWGGRKLETEFGYEIPAGPVGECWAISAHPAGDDEIASGEYAGRTLSWLWDEHRELFGNCEGDRFPLLVKIIDAKDDLSIQVHPDDDYAAEHENGSLGKRECWYVLSAEEGGTIISSQKVGPSIADDIKVAAIWSVILAVIAIGLYILLRFRNIAYSIGSVAALTFDTLAILGIYSMFWGILPFSMEIDQTFIGAILTAVGYSINDKVVIFDRVREYFHLYPKRNKFQLFNDSLNSTLTRTLYTGSSTLIVLVIIFFLGGESIRSFSFAMILGVVIGTLSSLFIASPIAYNLMRKKSDKEPVPAENA